jgi:hypothetical protein
MAAKKSTFEDGLTFAVGEKKEEYSGPKVTVFLPRLEEEGNGIKVDQYEHVTIANEEKEETFRILRGEPVEIPAYVFVVLKEKYPYL